MSINQKKIFPGGSKSKVNQAGDHVRKDISTSEDLKIIDEWRAAHRSVLNTFQSILRHRTKKIKVTVAQRHKRKRTIFDKLTRFPEMQLSRMDDIAGYRLIFENIEALYLFRNKFHKANFKHRLRNKTDKYDYIKHPKITGYRGIHDVYEYNVNSENGKSLTGLLIEIQYRTFVQHLWATAVEIIGFITESQPKFQKGDKRYEKAMALASEILARAFENKYGPFPELEGRKLVEDFLALDNELKLIQTLRGLRKADQAVTEKRNAILIFLPTGELEIKTFRDSTDALRTLFELEKKFPERDIVLVKAASSEEMKIAFKNYFSDTHDFIQLIGRGCEIVGRHSRWSSLII